MDKEDVKNEKLCVQRISKLDEIFQSKHGAIFYNLFFAALLGLIVNDVLASYLQGSELTLGIQCLRTTFGGFNFVILYWSILNVFSTLCFWCFIGWQKGRNNVVFKELWDGFWLLMVPSYYIASSYFLMKAILYGELAVASSFVILLEHTRILMKVHSFLRINAPNHLKKKQENKVALPTFYSYLYFMFAPTMIYRKSYPRNANIRWTFVIRNFMDILCITVFLSILWEKSFFNDFQNVCIEKYTWRDVVSKIQQNLLAGILSFTGLFYCILHATQNAFAEMLRFENRCFYEDWWTSRSHRRFFRTWNIVVNEWLYMFIYKEVYDWVYPNNKHAARFTVMFISGLVHELIAAATIRTFLPVLFLEFSIVGHSLAYTTNAKSLIGNIVLWYTLALGATMQCEFYLLEYYANRNCTPDNQSIFSFIIPKFIQCNCLTM